MKFLLVFFSLTAFLLLPAAAQIQASLDKADEYYDSDMLQQCEELLTAALTQAATNQEKAEIQWRLARVALIAGDIAVEKGAGQQELLKYFAEGEKYAGQAIASDPQNHLGYYWKASNIGRWGQVKGILDALDKAKPMQELLKEAVTRSPGHADSYLVLQLLYVQVPGWPVSFGNKEYGVSLGRKAVNLLQQDIRNGQVKKPNYGYYKELANSLYERNWDAGKRSKEQARMKQNYDKAGTVFDKSLYYEGTVTIDKESDRQEAVKLLKSAVQEMEKVPAAERNREQRNNLRDVKALLAKWS